MNFYKKIKNFIIKNYNEIEITEKGIIIEIDSENKYFIKKINYERVQSIKKLKNIYNKVKEFENSNNKVLNHSFLKINNNFILVSSFIEGNSLKCDKRNLIPEAFSKIAKFHLFNENNNYIFSPISRKKYFNIKSLIISEAKIFGKVINFDNFEKIMNIFSIFEYGIKTIIHGDLHPGNMISSNNNNIYFIDWEFALNSINFFDLDYLLFDNISETNWWDIKEEAYISLENYLSVFKDKIKEKNKSFRIEFSEEILIKALKLWNCYHKIINDRQFNNGFDYDILKAESLRLLNAE